jgi:hypothetical protein
MEIHYSDRDRVGDGRARAYAQYRVFEAFRCVASQVRTVDVSIGRDRGAGYPHRVTCTVLAELRDGEQITVTAMGDWPYAGGRGVPQDYVEAHKWGNLAASRATGDNRERYARTREALAKSMTPAQLAEAQKRAADWLAVFESRVGSWSRP